MEFEGSKEVESCDKIKEELIQLSEELKDKDANAFRVVQNVVNIGEYIGGQIQVEGEEEKSFDDDGGDESSLDGEKTVQWVENLSQNHDTNQLERPSELHLGRVGFSGNEIDGDSVDVETPSQLPKNAKDVDSMFGIALSNQKKNRKKKKKKKIMDDMEEFNHLALVETHMLPLDIADKRYATSLQAMRNNGSIILMQLNRCRISDKKARKLFVALKGNTTLTSLDLSENLLTDESMQFLMHVLASGLAPNLLYIDVRSNPISVQSQSALEYLQNLRKHLKVDVHPKTSYQVLGEGVGVDDEEYPRNKWIANDNLGYSPVIESCSSNTQPRLTNPQALQEKVECALLAIKNNSNNLQVLGLASNLREVIINFSQKLYHNPNNTEWETLEQLPKGLPLLLEKLGIFLSVLDMNPTPIPSQRKLEEQSAGLHRIALVELLNLVLVPTSQCIENQLLVEGAPTRLVKLFFQFPWNSILQGALYRALKAMLAKPTLRSSLLDGCFGLPCLLSKFGERCAALSIGKRPGCCGYIVKLSKEIELLGEKIDDIRSILLHNIQWMAYVGENGPLKQMMAEQLGHLGGPKPFLSKSTLLGHSLRKMI